MAKRAMNPRDVLVAPLITEKSISATSAGQYTFRVHPDASKTQIRAAVAMLFSVQVKDVNTIAMHGKRKTFARRGMKTEGVRSDWKKAIVTLAPGQTISLGGVNYFEQ